MPLYGNRMARFGNYFVNNEYSLRFSKSISNTAKGCLFCVLFLFCFCFVLFCCFCFVFVCLSFPYTSKVEMSDARTPGLAHKDIKTFEKMRNPKWRLKLSSTVIRWTYYFAGSFPNLSKPLDRWHDFHWIFLKVTKTLLGVINKGWGPKSFLTLL